jgi:hypothetical protein
MACANAGHRNSYLVSLLARISHVARVRALPCILCGGHAVIFHGVPRSTFDFDFVIRRNDRSGWLELLGEVGYTIYRENPTFLQMNGPDGTSPPVDLMFVSQETFNKLATDSLQAPEIMFEARVISLRHLLAMKCHAIKNAQRARVEKDVDDVIALVRINDIDLGQSEWKELILKHGPPELYEKLARITKS